MAWVNYKLSGTGFYCPSVFYYLLCNRRGLLKRQIRFYHKKKIDINTVRKVSETNNPISAPAASFDRLEIVYNQYDSILISPKDKSGFIDHITRVNPQIEVRHKTRDKN